jgi:hypothetical protein
VGWSVTSSRWCVVERGVSSVCMKYLWKLNQRWILIWELKKKETQYFFCSENTKNGLYSNRFTDQLNKPFYGKFIPISKQLFGHHQWFYPLHILSNRLEGPVRSNQGLGRRKKLLRYYYMQSSDWKNQKISTLRCHLIFMIIRFMI